MSAGRLGLSRFLIVPLSLALVALAMGAPLVAAKNGGNSASAKMCQKGGWMELVRSDDTPFASQGECVSYAAQGGTLTPGTPGTADLSLSPGRLDATTDGGTKVYGYDFTASATQTFTVTNNGTAASNLLSVFSVASTVFVLANDDCSGHSLAAGGATCTFDITATAPAECDTGTLFGALVVDVGFQENGHPYIILAVTGRCPP